MKYSCVIVFLGMLLVGGKAVAAPMEFAGFMNRVASGVGGLYGRICEAQKVENEPAYAVLLCVSPDNKPGFWYAQLRLEGDDVWVLYAAPLSPHMVASAPVERYVILPQEVTVGRLSEGERVAKLREAVLVFGARL